MHPLCSLLAACTDDTTLSRALEVLGQLPTTRRAAGVAHGVLHIALRTSLLQEARRHRPDATVVLTDLQGPANYEPP